jgi:mono/diheme cytochrome c family protein
MSRSVLGFVPVSGFMVACLLGACTAPEKTAPTCIDDSCGDETDTGDDSSGDGELPKDAGGSGMSSKDSGPPALVDAGAKSGSPSGSTALPCDVAKLVTAHCGSCHGTTPAGGAPMTLRSALDFQAMLKSGKTARESVKSRINETDTKKVMPPAGTNPLSKAELGVLNTWLDKGAPGATETDTCTDKPATSASDGEVEVIETLPSDDGPIDTSGLTCYKLTAHNGDFKTPYRVGVATDSYVNFTFAAPWKGTAYGIVIRPVIDNTKAIHHWLLFEDDTPGVPSGATKGTGAHPSGQLLHGWAPGGDPLNFRLTNDDVGLELPATTYTVEFHYNSSDPTAADASGVEICVQQTAPKNIAALSWLGNDNLLIPSNKWSGTCAPLSQEPIHIVGVSPHMHLKGTHMKGTITRANGTKAILHDEDFDFNYQRSYRKNAVLMPGDTITTECTFSEPMSFGESTKSEMCYLFTMAYPKGALAGPDVWGTFAHGGSSCLGM